MPCLIRSLCFLFLGFLSGSRAQDPCDTGFKFVVGIERDPLYIPSESRINVCDVLTEGWYRIIGPGQVDLDLYNRQPIRGRCDTAYPIWMNGDIPTGGAQVTNEMCMVDEVENCTDRKSLPVKDCGNYRVYRLSSPSFCAAAFCVEFPNRSPTTTAVGCQNTIANISDAPDVSPFVAESDDPELNKNGRGYEELKFTCELPALESNWFYDVIWSINGEVLAFQPLQVPGSEYNLTNLLERHWRDNFKMGMKVKCTVAARFQRNCVRGPEVASEEFFAGIKVSPTNIALDELGESRNITYTCTVPISCQPNRVDPCSVYLSTINSRSSVYDCPLASGGSATAMCQPIFSNLDWDQPKTLTTYSVYSKDFDNRAFVISTETTGHRHPDYPDVWRNLILPTVRVAIVDVDRYLTDTTCYVWNDPNYYTFNNNYFPNDMQGEIVMFRHKSVPVAVHVLQEDCGLWLTCVCGVAVQSGLDVFTWVGCGAVKQIYKQFRMRPFGCFKSGIRVEEMLDGKKYRVHTNNGIVVTVEQIGNIFLEVTIDAPPDNQGQVEGMCGNLGPLGSDGSEPHEQWSVSRENSLFNNTARTEGRTFKVSFCSCDDNSTLQCHPSIATTLPCDARGDDVTERFTYACGQKRDLILQDLDEEWPDFGFNLSYVPPPPVWMNGWSQLKAEEYCTNFHQTSEVYKRCAAVEGISLDASTLMCVDMIHATGDVMWSSQTLEAYKSECRFEVTRNSSYWISSTGQTSVFDSVLEIMCPENCSGYGTCNKGVCECDSSHLGADCGLDIFKPPSELVLLNKGLCDLNKKLCQGVLVIGSQFVNMEKFGCSLQMIEVSESGKHETGKMAQCRASYHTRNEAMVIIEPFEDFDDLGYVITPTVIGYKLALTNDETSYSDDVIFLPHDSTCFVCDITKQNAACQIKEGYCNIDYQCVASGTSKADDSCAVCDPSRSTVTWTNIGVCECDSSHLGADCGLDIFKPPSELVLPNKGLCDLNKTICQEVLVIGSQFVNMEKFGCSLQMIEVSESGIHETGKMAQCRASYHTRNEALVIIEPFEDFDDLGDVITPTVIGYKLALTNDETNYSYDVIFLPHDSTCFVCDITKQNAACQIKERYCNIDYQCVASGTSKADYSCAVCDPTGSTVTWTYIGCFRSSDGSIPLWIPFVVSVGVICVVALVLGVIALHIKKQKANSQCVRPMEGLPNSDIDVKEPAHAPHSTNFTALVQRMGSPNSDIGVQGPAHNPEYTNTVEIQLTVRDKTSSYRV